MGILNLLSRLFGLPSASPLPGANTQSTRASRATEVGLDRPSSIEPSVFQSADQRAEINPATGLPTTHGVGSVDVQGNSYGTTASGDDSAITGIGSCPDPLNHGLGGSIHDPFHDPFGSSFRGMGDSFGTGSSFDDW